MEIYDKYSDIDTNIVKNFDFYFTEYNNIFDAYYDIYTNKSIEEAKEFMEALKTTKKLASQDYIDMYISHYKNG